MNKVPFKETKALLFVIDIIPNIPSPIRPGVSTLSMHCVDHPFPIVLSTITPAVNTYNIYIYIYLSND